VAGARSNRMLLSGSENDNYILATNHRNSNVANQRRSNQNEGSRLTALLLTVSFTFLVLTLPFNIVMIITRLWNDTSGKNN
ncbi:FMRFamide receptor, partial [Biomphalaria pfeifferi]